MNTKVQRQFLVKHKHLHAVGITWTSWVCEIRLIFSQRTSAVWLRSSCETHSVKGEKNLKYWFSSTWLHTSERITSNWKRKQDWKVWAWSCILTAHDCLPLQQSSDLMTEAQLLWKMNVQVESLNTLLSMIHRNHSFFGLISHKMWVRVKAPCLYCDFFCPELSNEHC